MRPLLAITACAMLLSGCNPGPRMYDKSYQPGQYNVQDIQFVAANARIAESEDYRFAEKIVTDLLGELLPHDPYLPPVNLVITVNRAGEYENERRIVTYDKDGKAYETNDIVVTTAYELASDVSIVEPSTGGLIGAVSASESEELHEMTTTSSFTETLVNSLFSGSKEKVDLPKFYLQYTQKLVHRLYPPRD